ncbi:hypothetical protein [Pseudanabaena sp. BC1403]|uniref:hypothetical protein n=1 Tax=Pseudanabaena sp. BC1403 TaxID=2043171 RepID=UPI0015E1A39E|nr:hypothetical protein [Pseudanabaena sp. BC1403]
MFWYYIGFKLSTITPTIYLLKPIAITVSHDFYAIASTIYLLKAIAITVSHNF